MKNTRRLSAYAAGATTPAEVLAFHRATFGNARMEASDGERPEGVSEEEWNALGDPGKAALQRERQARTEAEQKLADASRPKPTPPAQKAPEQKPESKPGGGEQGQATDIAALIQQAVQQAVAPFQEQQQQWQADQAVAQVRDQITKAAAPRFHDVTDVLAQIDTSDLTDGAGSPDAAKIDAALSALAQAKPHLVKPQYDPRTTAPGAMFGGSAGTPQALDDRVKESLARMQLSAGIRSNKTA